jgi:hypothetical protein
MSESTSTERVRRFRERQRRGDRMVTFRLTADEQRELARLGYLDGDDFNTAAEACLSDTCSKWPPRGNGRLSLSAQSGLVRSSAFIAAMKIIGRRNLLAGKI